MRRASLVGALLALGLLLAGGPVTVLAQAGVCASDRIDERVRVRYVHDGDTVSLTDGRKIRLIGLNTPELGKDGKPHQPFAIAARDALRRLLFANGQQLQLRIGKEARDRYDRVLAHGFLNSGDSLAAQLLRDGLAFAIVRPPNLWGADCYQQAEQAARDAGKGVWGGRDDVPQASSSLSLRDQGFRLVTGRVTRVGNSRDALWLNLEGRVALRIPKENLAYFPESPGRYAGKRVEARGWFMSRKGELRTNIYHPAGLRLLEEAAAGHGQQDGAAEGTISAP